MLYMTGHRFQQVGGIKILFLFEYTPYKKHLRGSLVICHLADAFLFSELQNRNSLPAMQPEVMVKQKDYHFLCYKSTLQFKYLGSARFFFFLGGGGGGGVVAFWRRITALCEEQTKTEALRMFKFECAANFLEKNAINDIIKQTGEFKKYQNMAYIVQIWHLVTSRTITWDVVDLNQCRLHL